MTRPVRNARYCASSGRSRPSACRSFVDVLRRRALAQHRLRRIAGHEVDQREDERRDAEQHGNREQQPPDQVASHSGLVRISQPTSDRNRRRRCRSRRSIFASPCRDMPSARGGPRALARRPCASAARTKRRSNSRRAASNVLPVAAAARPRDVRRQHRRRRPGRAAARGPRARRSTFCSSRTLPGQS